MNTEGKMDNFKKWASINFPLWARLVLTIIVGGSIFAWLLPWLLTNVLPRLDKTLGLPSLYFGLPNKIIGWALLAVGVFFAVWSIGQQLFKAQGTPIPVMATQKLLIRGVFKYCRNPMGFGAICMYLGCAVLAGSICSLLAVILFSGLFILYIKKIEEKELTLRFGEEYEAYKKSTPFIIPRFFGH
jgi:protein-S-isoprenylcysteine O-methyltransferase Ste14